jgi:hypothetical protein
VSGSGSKDIGPTRLDSSELKETLSPGFNLPPATKDSVAVDALKNDIE